jgi:hypothetical protein
MPDPTPTSRISVTISLPAPLAQRLKSAAEAQNRPAQDLVLDLLDRHLPQVRDPNKPKIPYF